jgi:hypothetical protein
MRKAFGWFVRTLFGLLLVGMVGYNTLETARLRAEVEAIEHRTGGINRAAAEPPATVTASEDFADAARQHAKAAEALFQRGDYAGARREMERATDSVRRANAEARERGQQVVDDLRIRVAALSSKLDALTGHGAVGASRTEPKNKL